MYTWRSGTTMYSYIGQIWGIAGYREDIEEYSEY